MIIFKLCFPVILVKQKTKKLCSFMEPIQNWPIIFQCILQPWINYVLTNHFSMSSVYAFIVRWMSLTRNLSMLNEIELIHYSELFINLKDECRFSNYMRNLSIFDWLQLTAFCYSKTFNVISKIFLNKSLLINFLKIYISQYL